MEPDLFIVTTDLLATKGQRFLNFVFDLFFISIINASIIATVFIISSQTNNEAMANWMDAHRKMMPCLWVLVAFLYYSLSEIYFSRTAAKYITKTMVIMKDGSRVTEKAVLKRTLCRFIPFEPFSFLGDICRGWHDTISKTYVVKKHKLIEKKGHDPSFG